MYLLPLAVCFLFIFCGHGHKRPHHRHVAPAVEQTCPAGVRNADCNVPAHARNDGNEPCVKVLKGWDSWGNRDDFVKQFPPSQQHHVLVCLDGAERGSSK